MSRSWESDKEVKFSLISKALLDRSGGAMPVDEAAKAMRMDRQTLDEQISSGRVLAVFSDGQILVPKLQLTTDGCVLVGIERVLDPFTKTGAGPWMALEFLCTWDSNLARVPIDALREGKIDEVVRAAEAYVHFEG